MVLGVRYDPGYLPGRHATALVDGALTDAGRMLAVMFSVCCRGWVLVVEAGCELHSW